MGLEQQQSTITPEQEDSEAQRKADSAKASRAYRARQKAKTEAGAKMAISQTTVDRKEADEILRLERGLSGKSGTSAHIRKVIFELSKDAAESLGLPGPNYHLIRYGYTATKLAMTDPDFVPSERDLIDNPNATPDGELLSRLELFCMMEMQSWNPDFMSQLTPTKDEALQRGNDAIDTAVSTGEITPERADELKQAAPAIQELTEQGYSLREMFLAATMRAELDRLGPAEEARIRGLSEDEQFKILSELPMIKAVVERFPEMD